jgi:outer membrane protein OmpA-like peptidoglycan-associated protein
MNGYLETADLEDENLLELLSEDELDEWETGASSQAPGRSLSFPPERITVRPRLVLEGFCFNQHWLNENHLMMLKSFVNDLAKLARRGSVSIRLVGHTDNIGTRANNEALGLRRAQRVGAKLRAFSAKVFNRLQRSGVRLGRIKIVEQSLGETRPVASNSNEAGRARNRRVEIFVSQPPQP